MNAPTNYLDIRFCNLFLLSRFFLGEPLLFEHLLGVLYLLWRDLLPHLLQLAHNLGEPRALGSADPFQLQPLGTDSQLLHTSPQPLDTAFSPVIGVDIMAVVDVAARDQYQGSALLEGVEDEFLGYPSAAHGADEAVIRRILQPGYSGQVASGIAAPVAEEADDLLLGL